MAACFADLSAKVQPVAQHTALGWIISGPVFECAPSTPGRTSLGSFSGGLDYDLHKLVSRFWTQEDASPDTASTLSEDEKQCKDHFVTTHSRSASGRYTVRLPFRASPPKLGDSYLAASRMLCRMRSRFRDDAELRQLYCDFMHEYELLGHMIRVPPSVRPEDSCFLPHHGVLRKGLATSKLPVVFNGSLRTANGKSLNDHLHVGPKLQHDIADLILRSRCYAFVFLADIEKMYRQIIVHHEDRDFQRILWGLTDVPDEFHLCTVTYGLACAPFLALRVIKQLADDEEHRYPAAATTLRENMYIDDVLSGADTLELTQAKTAQTDQILMAGGFCLHKWMANHEAILSHVGLNRHESPPTREFRVDTLTRALGLSWDHSTAFVFRLTRADPPSVWTKRVVFSRVAQLFDPLGWITPVTILARIFLQELWTLKVDWDDTLPASLVNRWTTFEDELQRYQRYPSRAGSA